MNYMNKRKINIKDEKKKRRIVGSYPISSLYRAFSISYFQVYLDSNFSLPSNISFLYNQIAGHRRDFS